MRRVIMIDGPAEGEILEWFNESIAQIRLANQNRSGDPLHDPEFTDYRVSQMILFGYNFWIGYSCSEEERNKAAFDFFVKSDVAKEVMKIMGGAHV